MKTGYKIRRSLKFKSVVNNFFLKHKTALVICIMFLLLGIISAIFTVIKYSDAIKIDNIFDNNFLLIIKGDRGVVGSFFSYLLIFLVFFGVIIFFNFKPWMMTFTFIILFYSGYVIGYNITILIVLFSFTGLLNGLLLVLPLELLVCLVLLIASAVAIKRCLIIKKFGCTYFNNTCGFNINMFYLYLFLAGVLLILLKCSLLPIIRITIII